MNLPKKLFISGTDTDIGKTMVSSILVAALKAGYWKPVQAGTEPETDTDFLRRLTKLPDSHYYPERYLLSRPMSPHAAAQADGVNIDINEITLPHYSQNNLIIEGAGGLMVPLNRHNFVIDLITHFDIPTLLVAKSGLGTLNHTLLSIEAIRKRNIELAGVVLIGGMNLSNEKAIRFYGGVEHIWRLSHIHPINPKTVLEAYNKTFVMKKK